ncbi:MAG: ABC transporter permease [Rubellimicrobium sp.]|nr:ABC transporter permease [Rubellimicrobium sp.]
MFDTRRSASPLASAFRMAELVYHSTVHHVRRGHRNALGGLLMAMAQTVIFVAAFYLMFALIGIRGSAIRGDYLLYLMSGVFLFMFHTRTLSAVARAEGPASSMMQHAPLNPYVTMTAAALGALYLQFLSLVVLLFLYHVIWVPIEIEDPFGAIGMILLAWFSGFAIGIVFHALRPWAPDLSQLLTNIWSRLNMVFSGKMFVANTMPAHLLVYFSWNPLFHMIDQARGFIFVNYEPHFSDWRYALWVSIAVFVVGLMAENFTRKHASASWAAGK